MPSIILLHIIPLLDDNIFEELPDLDEEFEESFELLPPDEDEEEQLIIFVVCSGLKGSGMPLLPIVLLLLFLVKFCWC